MKHLLILLLAAFSVQLPAFSQPLPLPISAFSRQAITNTTAAGWQTKLGVASSNSVAGKLDITNGVAVGLGGTLTNAVMVGGSVQSVTNTGATGSRVMVFDANAVPTNSAVTATTLTYLDATSSVQTQMDAKASSANLTTVSNLANTMLPLSGGTMTGNILSSGSVQGTLLRTDTVNSYDNGYSLFTIDGGDGRLRLYGNGVNVIYLTSSKLEQRNGTTSQSFDTFHTYTDASNYQGARLAQSAGAVTLSALTAGTGADNVDIALTPAGTGGVVINGGTALRKVLSAAAALDFGNILATASADLTITVTGAAVGDSVALGPPAAPDASIVFNAFVSAADTVTVRSFNVGAIAVDQASATFRVTIFSF